VADVLIAVDGSLVDPNDEGALDKLLADSMESATEPRLLIVERLLSRLRIRREV